jgi:hypothetical protein
MAKSGFKVVPGDIVSDEHHASAPGVYLAGVKVVGPAEDLIADASEAHALNSTFSDTEAEAALNALGVKINAILALLIAHGLMAAE